MKNSILAGFALILISLTACQTEQRYTQQSPEIETVRKAIKDYNNKDYNFSNFADTAKTFFNTSDKPMTNAETAAYHKGNDANYSSRGFTGKNEEYEMVKTDDGETWVNYWGDWSGTLAANGKKISFPISLTYRFVDGKIVRRLGYWDPSQVILSLMELDAAANMPAGEKTINTVVEQIAKALNTKDMDLLKANAAPDFVRNMNGIRQCKSLKDYMAVMQGNYTSLPDFGIKVDELTIKGNDAFLKWTLTGTNTGKFNGNAPTNKKVNLAGFSKWSFDKDGKATQEDVYFDYRGFYKQMGLTASK